MIIALQDSLKSGTVIPPAAGRWDWVALKSAVQPGGFRGLVLAPWWKRLSPMHLAAWCEGSQNGASGCWVGEQPGTVGLGGGVQNAVCWHRVPVVERDPCFHCVCPQEASQLSPTSQDQQVGTPQDSYKLLPLWWFQSLWDFMCALQNQSLISYDSLALPYTEPHSCLQNQTFLGLVFPLWESQSGEPDVGLQPLTLWG